MKFVCPNHQNSARHSSYLSNRLAHALLLLSVSTVVGTASSPSWALTEADQAQKETAIQADSEPSTRKHNHDYERIQVTASPLKKSAENSAQPIHVLGEDDLRQAQAASLGETLRHIPGVQASFFGPTASSPIIRGLDGPRVKIVQNGLDAADISRGGPDHAIATETSIAQQIEVFRGPSTLLFGNGASGGVVNIVDARIPRDPVDGLTGFVSGVYNSNTQEKTGAAGLDAGQGDFAFHLDAYQRKSSDLKVPRFTTEALGTQKEIENSFTDDSGFNLGSSYFFDTGFAGISYGRIEREYGLPAHFHDHDHEQDHDHEENEHEHESPVAFFTQDRYQFSSSFMSPFAFFEQVDFNLGYTELTHEEREGHQVETGYELEQTEARLTATHINLAGWKGALGLQYQKQTQVSFGEEAFTPDTDTQMFGTFWLLERQLQKTTFEMGARIERFKLTAQQLGAVNFTPLSISAGLNHEIQTGLAFFTNLSYSERAPQSDELYAQGAHYATQSFELGRAFELIQTNVDTLEIQRAEGKSSLEKVTNLDTGFHYDGQKTHLELNLYYNLIKDFYYQKNLDPSLYTSILLDGNPLELNLPIYHYQQQDAVLYGYELSGHYEFNERWHLGGFTDGTRGYFKGQHGQNKYIPRMPAQRAEIHLAYFQADWDSQIGYTRYLKQNKIAANETPTEAFGLLNFHLNYYPLLNSGAFGGRLQDADLAIYFKAENLNNQLGFVHSSFIKEYAPLPGRNFNLGVRLQF